MTNQAIEPFEFGTHRVRMAGTADAPLFCAADVCKVLGLADTASSCRRLDQDEVHEVASKQPIRQTGTTAGMGGRKALYVTESGLFSLIMTSTKPEARAFKKWVTSEVLPEIRRKGAYSLVERTERKRIVSAFFLALPEKQASLFDPLIEALRGLARKSDGGSGGTPPWARMVASWIYTWTFSKYKNELRKRNPVSDDGTLVWRDYETLSEEGRKAVSITIGIACFAAKEARSWDDWKSKMEAFFQGATYQNWLPFSAPSNRLQGKAS